ncbi:MAG: IS1 family transposase [Gammaproteobacteria bacterium]|nr:IS1 family transposase [Gammaproteobacteria bacterium]
MNSPIELMSQKEKDVLLHQLAFTVNTLQAGYVDLNDRVNVIEALLKDSLDKLPAWQQHAISLYVTGSSVNSIAATVGKSRQSVSKLINKPEIKAAIEAQLKGVK